MKRKIVLTSADAIGWFHIISASYRISPRPLIMQAFCFWPLMEHSCTWDRYNDPKPRFKARQSFFVVVLIHINTFSVSIVGALSAYRCCWLDANEFQFYV